MTEHLPAGDRLKVYAKSGVGLMLSPNDLQDLADQLDRTSALIEAHKVSRRANEKAMTSLEETMTSLEAAIFNANAAKRRADEREKHQVFFCFVTLVVLGALQVGGVI
jgi:multidrug resistance efflux pump